MQSMWPETQVLAVRKPRQGLATQPKKYPWARMDLTEITESQLLGVVSLLASLVLLVVNLRRRRNALALLQEGSEADAKVVASDYHYLDGDSWYRTYVTLEDDIASARLLLSSSSRFELGEQVRVVHAPKSDSPVIELSRAVEWHSEKGLWALGSVWWPIGFLAMVGLLLLLFPSGETLG